MPVTTAADDILKYNVFIFFYFFFQRKQDFHVNGLLGSNKTFM